MPVPLTILNEYIRMKLKYRICRCYNPLVGTWYVIQKKRFFWWKTLPFAFKELYMANQFIKVKENTESLCITNLTYNWLESNFEDAYPCHTDVIEIKT